MRRAADQRVGPAGTPPRMSSMDTASSTTTPSGMTDVRAYQTGGRPCL